LLPHTVAAHCMWYVLRQKSITIDKSRIQELVIYAKTLSVGKSVDVSKHFCLKIIPNGPLAASIMIIDKN
jgi:hypothetical protein